MARGKVITATGHIVSNAAYLHALVVIGDGGGVGRALFYDASTATNAALTNDEFRVEVPSNSGASVALAFSDNYPLQFDTAMYVTCTNLRTVSVVYTG